MEDRLETPEIDVEKVMEQIRKNVRKRRQGLPPSKAASPLPPDQVAADLTSLHRGNDIYPLHFTSHRGVLGRLVVLAKKMLQQLLTPILERQLAYNAANTRVTSALWEQVATLRQQQAEALQALRVEVGAQLAGVQQQQAAVQAAVAAVGQCQADTLRALRAEAKEEAAERKARMAEWESTIARLKTESILHERRITLLLEEARKRLPDARDQAYLRSAADAANSVLDALYVSFEDQFRGTRADIKERLRVYLPILQEAQLGSEAKPILDVGCGRGEWLELLQETGLWGQGVDRNRVLVEQCQRRGLRVVEGDVLTYLGSLPYASLGAFHIIEHLPLEVLIKVLDETVRVLTSGGVAVFETPNPQNVLVGSHNFYLDPTHRNPLPSSIMKLMAEARGLCRVQIFELHPYPEASRVQEAGLDVAKRFNECFYGPQGYAVVGWKA
jgi:O-antigen chain-terminating methyltransferase